MSVKLWMTDGQTSADAALFSRAVDIQATGPYLAKKAPFAYEENRLIFPVDVAVTLGEKTYIVEAGTELDESALDTGSFEVGKDYRVFLAGQGAGGLVISKQELPAGVASENCRLIGGFHYGHIRKVSPDWIPVDSEGTPWGEGATLWEDNVTTGIVPNSVWDQKNRPRCDPAGMARVGQVWIDIYLSSSQEGAPVVVENEKLVSGALQSLYGGFPLTGLNGYVLRDLVARSGKRLLGLSEWLQMACGNPPGEDGANNYGFTNTTNTEATFTGCQIDPATGNYSESAGIKGAAISAFNLVDCVGNLGELTFNVVGDTSSKVIVCGGMFNNGTTAHNQRIYFGELGVTTSHRALRLCCEAL